MCSFCGLVLPSPVAVTIHQMVVDVSARDTHRESMLSGTIHTTLFRGAPVGSKSEAGRDLGGDAQIY